MGGREAIHSQRRTLPWRGGGAFCALAAEEGRADTAAQRVGRSSAGTDITDAGVWIWKRIANGDAVARHATGARPVSAPRVAVADSAPRARCFASQVVPASS